MASRSGKGQASNNQEIQEDIMKLPQMTAERSLIPMIGRYGLRISSDGRAGALSPMADIRCLEDCVGSNTAARCRGCGRDMKCWAECAGEGSPACVEQCYQPG